MNFNNCPICNLELIEFAAFKKTFVCKNKHIIGLYFNEATVRWDDIGFSFSKNKISFMFLEKEKESNFELINGQIISVLTVNVLNYIEIDFYPDLTDIPKLLKKINMIKVFS